MDSMLVKARIDPPGQFATDARHLAQIFDAGSGDTLKPAEMLDQQLALFGTDALDTLERRGIAGTRTALTVAGDGKAMRLVADPLDQMQCRGIVVQAKRPTVIDQYQPKTQS